MGKGTSMINGLNKEDVTVPMSKVFLVNMTEAQSSFLKRALEDDDYQVVASVNEANDLVNKVDQSGAEIVVLCLDSPNAFVLEQLTELNACSPKPVIMFAEYDAPSVIKQVVASGVSAYVVAEIHPHRIRSTISVAVIRFKEQQTLLTELKNAQTQLADRKLVDRAKGLLMEHQGLTEDQAYKKLRKMSMDKGKNLASVAESVVDILSL
ncbi:ANTAR domain-containing response regulator [Litoribacillus peritrichatus]|uniref:ANTAR domain-containing protein n=1 Tax=Litoribacillus peritrichatus TaxID=718191 RepID=A0ABP7N6V0_9GAMM